MNSLKWAVRVEHDEEGLPRIYPSGFFRFVLQLHDVETDVLLGTIESFNGFWRDRHVFAVYPPVTRGDKSEIYFFVHFTPEKLVQIRDAVEAEIQRVHAEREARRKTHLTPHVF